MHCQKDVKSKLVDLQSKTNDHVGTKRKFTLLSISELGTGEYPQMHRNS